MADRRRRSRPPTPPSPASSSGRRSYMAPEQVKGQSRRSPCATCSPSAWCCTRWSRAQSPFSRPSGAESMSAVAASTPRHRWTTCGPALSPLSGARRRSLSREGARAAVPVRARPDVRARFRRQLTSGRQRRVDVQRPRQSRDGRKSDDVGASVFGGGGRLSPGLAGIGWWGRRGPVLTKRARPSFSRVTRFVAVRTRPSSPPALSPGRQVDRATWPRRAGALATSG